MLEMKLIWILIFCLKEAYGLLFTPGKGCGSTKEIKVLSRVNSEDTRDNLQDCSLVLDEAVEAKLIFNTPAGICTPDIFHNLLISAQIRNHLCVCL